VTDEFDDPESRALDRRTSIGIGVTLVVAAMAIGALLGELVPSWTGIEAVTVFEITFVLSPAMTGVYAGVGAATFLVTLALVFQTIARLDDRTV
jgi:hypothetical protein